MSLWTPEYAVLWGQGFPRVGSAAEWLCGPWHKAWLWVGAQELDTEWLIRPCRKITKKGRLRWERWAGHLVEDRGCRRNDEDSLPDQSLVRLPQSLFSTWPWPWPSVSVLPLPGLHHPVLARILLSQFRHPWYLITLACCQQESCSVGLARIPLPLLSPLNTFPSTDPLALVFGYEFPAVFGVFRVELSSALRFPLYCNSSKILWSQGITMTHTKCDHGIVTTWENIQFFRGKL